MSHSLATALPMLIVGFTTPIVIWSSMFAVWAAQRTNGRRAVEAELRRLRERAVSIENVPLRTLTDRAGLCGGCVFRVTAQTREGEVTTHLWAYAPSMIPTHLQRLAHGIWIPA